MSYTRPPALIIDNLSKNYGKITAVKDLSLTILPGSRVALIGPNGAGKSTTMRCIAGLCVPDEGSIRIASYDIQKAPLQARAYLGYVSQEIELYRYLTGLEFLHFLARVRTIDPETAKERIETLLAVCSLEEAKNRLIRDYSGGMARKLAMAAALISMPALVVLDESFVGLDPESTYIFRQYLMNYTKQGGAVLISSHILEMLQNFCTHFVFIHKGSVVANYSLEELLEKCEDPKHPNINALYLHLTEQSHLIDDFDI